MAAQLKFFLPDQGVTLEQPLGVLVIELEKLTGSTTDLGESEGDAPDLALVFQAVFADDLELCVEPGRLEGSPGNLCDYNSEEEKHVQNTVGYEDSSSCRDSPLLWTCEESERDGIYQQKGTDKAHKTQRRESIQRHQPQRNRKDDVYSLEERTACLPTFELRNETKTS
jgi:hypothetical protein